MTKICCLLLLIAIVALAICSDTILAEKIYSFTTTSSSPNSGRLFVMDTNEMLPSWTHLSTSPLMLDFIGPYPFCISYDKSMIMAGDMKQRLALYHFASEKWSNAVPIRDSMIPDGCVGTHDNKFGSVFMTFYLRYPHEGSCYIQTRTYNTTLSVVKEGIMRLSTSPFGRITSWSYSHIDGTLILSVGDVHDLSRDSQVFICDVTSTSPSCSSSIRWPTSYHAFMADTSRSDYSLIFGRISANTSNIIGYNRRGGDTITLINLAEQGYKICDDVKLYNVPSTESLNFHYALLCPLSSNSIVDARLVKFDKRTGKVHRVFGLPSRSTYTKSLVV